VSAAQVRPDVPGKEGAKLAFRLEFNNIFNRTNVVNPVSVDEQATQTATTGKTSPRFGWITPPAC
jgi:hypothetical protein